MERLTYRRDGDGAVCLRGMTKTNAPETVQKAAELLFRYEETGLEPEEVSAQLGLLRKYSEAVDCIGIKRIRELAQAEKDGRLVVLAVNPYLKPAQTNEVFICENGGVWPIYVTGCEVGPNSEGRLAVIYETVDGDVFCDTDIGKTVFLTRQEAEDA